MNGNGTQRVVSYPQPHALKHTFTHREPGMYHSGLCLDSSPVTPFAFVYTSELLSRGPVVRTRVGAGSDSATFSMVTWIRTTGSARLK